MFSQIWIFGLKTNHLATLIRTGLQNFEGNLFRTNDRRRRLLAHLRNGPIGRAVRLTDGLWLRQLVFRPKVVFRALENKFKEQTWFARINRQHGHFVNVGFIFLIASYFRRFKEIGLLR
jgi:hypothetical protein